MTVTKKQSGRKRWGGGGGVSDMWDDWGDFDLASPSKTTKRALAFGGSANKENDDDDLFGWVYMWFVEFLSGFNMDCLLPLNNRNVKNAWCKLWNCTEYSFLLAIVRFMSLYHCPGLWLYFEGSGPEWYISTIYHAWDILFLSGTFNLLLRSLESSVVQLVQPNCTAVPTVMGWNLELSVRHDLWQSTFRLPQHCAYGNNNKKTPTYTYLTIMLTVKWCISVIVIKYFSFLLCSLGGNVNDLKGKSSKCYLVVSWLLADCSCVNYKVILCWHWPGA